ncbi:MAG: ATP-binding protein, partial [Caldisphaeraceae archaeon]|nr:ATP-binding protein [Caldisphaeraceae archaeon]
MTIINRENCFYYYDERLWCDYSSSLKDIRKRAERHIDEFIQSNKARSLVIQAPYGSGKSTLLRYLLVYSWEKGIPAILVNLSSIVKFIASSNKEYTLGYIPEDDLPNIIEQFYNKIKAEVLNNPESIKKYTNNINISNFQEILNRSNNFVILIDEVEEALENLRKIISSQTSPFRT